MPHFNKLFDLLLKSFSRENQTSFDNGRLPLKWRGHHIYVYIYYTYFVEMRHLLRIRQGLNPIRYELNSPFFDFDSTSVRQYRTTYRGIPRMFLCSLAKAGDLFLRRLDLPNFWRRPQKQNTTCKNRFLLCFHKVSLSPPSLILI